jgi:hypothetical protein
MVKVSVNMTVVELKKIARTYGVKVSGTKAQLIARLRAYKGRKKTTKKKVIKRKSTKKKVIKRKSTKKKVIKRKPSVKVRKSLAEARKRKRLHQQRCHNCQCYK